MVEDFSSFCRGIKETDLDDDLAIYSWEYLKRATVPITLPVFDNWDDAGVQNPFNQQRTLAPSTCFPEPSTMTPPTYVYPPIPFWQTPPQTWSMEETLQFSLTIAGILYIPLFGGYFIAARVFGCTASAWFGFTTLTARQLPAYLSPAAISQFSTLAQQAIRAGFAPIAITGILADATTEKNKDWKIGDPLDKLKALDPYETAAAIKKLMDAGAMKMNPYYQNIYKNLCTTTDIKQICPTTTITGGALTPGPTFTSTEAGDVCDDKYTKPNVLPTTTGFRARDTLGRLADILKLYLTLSPDLRAGLDAFNLDFSFGKDGLQLILFSAFNPQFQAPVYLSPYTPGTEMAADLTDACKQNPGRKIFFCAQFQFTPKGGSCKKLTVTICGSYNCKDSSTTPEGPGIVFTKDGETPPVIPDILKKLVDDDAKQWGPVTPRAPLLTKPPACSVELCPIAQNPPKTCAAPSYCNKNCQCVEAKCGNGDIERIRGEECDPPGSLCAAGVICNDQCQCVGVPKTRSERPSLNTGMASLSGAAVQSALTEETLPITHEQWILTSGAPAEEATVTYKNNVEQQASGIFMRDPFTPKTITHADGTTTTFTYQNNKLQTITHPAFTKTYSYKNDELDRVVTKATQGASSTTSFTYTPIRDYMVVDVFTDLFITGNNNEQQPMKLDTFLREQKKLPFSKAFLPYTTYLLTRTRAPDGSMSESKLVRDPQSARYTTISKQQHSSDGRLLQTEQILDVNGDDVYERHIILTYSYDSQDRVTKVTSSLGRTYTSKYDSDAVPSTLMGVYDDENDQVGKQEDWSVSL